MDLFFLIVFAVGLALLAIPVLTIIAWVNTRDLRRDVTRLQHTVQQLRVRLDALQAAPPAEPEAPRAPGTVAGETPREESFGETPAEPERRQPWRTAMPAPAARQGQAEPETPRPMRSLEEAMGTRWFVWLGGVAIALGAVFLVLYSIEMGWMGPAVQCISGAVLGFLLIGGGEWLRRRPFEAAIAAIRPSQVPPALTGAGVFALFVSVYAAYGFYGLLTPLVAFAALAAVWLSALALSLLHGWFVAALGILGGYLVPLLVETGHPSAYTLYPYLIAVTATALTVLRYRGWGWLAWGALAGAAAWPVLWMIAPFRDLGTPAVGFYLTATAALFIYLPGGLEPHRRPVSSRSSFAKLPLSALLAWAAAGVLLALALVLAVADDFGIWSVAWAGLLGAFLIAAGRRDETFDLLAVAAMALSALILILWDLPYRAGEIEFDALLPPGLVPFAGAAAGYAALYGFAGLFVLRDAPRPGLWAGLSAGAPVVVLAIAFWRIRDFEVDLGWASASLMLAGVELVLAWWLARHRDERGMEPALAAYAAGVVAAVSLAMTMALENAWLTVALSLQLPALAWIYDRTSVPGLRALALIIAGAVLVRLVFNYQLFDYPLGAAPGLNWMLYGYGLPTLAFYAAASMFRGSRDDRLVLALESGALVFLTLFVSLEISDLVHGGRFAPGVGLLETSLRSIAWLTIGYALLRQCRVRQPRLVAVWGWRILAGMAGLQVLLIQLLEKNPLVYRVDVGDWPAVNLLLLAYGAPALLAIALQRETDRQVVPYVPAVTGVAALALLFTWLSLEIRRAFHPNFLYLGGASDAEWWAYSGAWLLYALALLALGIWRRSIPLRHASRAVLLLTVAKVFLFDLSETGGLFRVASFLGLGLCLVGIGWLYGRYVFPPRDAVKKE